MNSGEVIAFQEKVTFWGSKMELYTVNEYCEYEIRASRSLLPFAQIFSVYRDGVETGIELARFSTTSSEELTLAFFALAGDLELLPEKDYVGGQQLNASLKALSHDVMALLNSDTCDAVYIMPTLNAFVDPTTGAMRPPFVFVSMMEKTAAHVAELLGDKPVLISDAMFSPIEKTVVPMSRSQALALSDWRTNMERVLVSKTTYVLYLADKPDLRVEAARERRETRQLDAKKSLVMGA